MTELNHRMFTSTYIYGCSCAIKKTVDFTTSRREMNGSGYEIPRLCVLSVPNTKTHQL